MTESTWTASWIDAPEAAFPSEQYHLKCVLYGGDCSAEAVAEAVAVNRGVELASVAGLDPVSRYTCFVETINDFGSTCSSPLDILTAGSSPVAPQPTDTIYIATDGSDSNPGTLASPVETFSKAQELVVAARQSSTDLYRIVFLPGVYTLSTTIQVSESYLEITSEDEESTNSTVLAFSSTGNFGISISDTSTDIYLHHLTLKQVDVTGVGVLITMNRSPGYGNEIITDWSKNISIYDNVIEVYKYGTFLLMT